VNTDLMFSTGKDDWATPPALFTALHQEFGFRLDAAANAINHRCSEWFGPDHPDNSRRNALYSGLSWGDGPVWINPPYSRGLQGKFIERAAREAIEGCRVVMLLPARTDTRAFHDHIWNRVRHEPMSWVREVRFIKGRLRFVGAPASAPFPSMIVVFGR
jgi:phage N-6-adenine-methyltransferase